jgi:nicotinamidase-related amidase
MRLRPDQSTLIVIDMQERLTPAMADPPAIVRGCTVLMRAARAMAVPVLVSEQYPRGLGRTLAELAAHAPEGATVEKLSFSRLDEPEFARRLATRAGDRRQMVLCGVETHVCVTQTALQLREAGHEVAVVADATGSRRHADRDMAFERLRQAGAQVVTSEMVVFEWLGRAGTNLFKEMSALIK